MEERDLWYGTKGRPDAPIVFVAESWGIEETRLKKPLVGESGKELDRMLALAKVDPKDVLFTNCIAEQPRGNETWRFFTPKESKPSRIGGLAPSDLAKSELSRLYLQLSAHPRKLIIAAGNYALWALTQQTKQKVLYKSNNKLIPKDEATWVPSGIMTWRGSMWWTEPHPELGKLDRIPLLPIVHPAAILRAWYMRDVTIHDLKTRVPMALRDDWRPNPLPLFWAPPTFEQCIGKLKEWLQRARSGPIWIASDIETARTVMTCIGFADSTSFAMSIPFIKRTPDGGFDSYWTVEQEIQIVQLLQRLFSDPNILIYGQNFIYDTQYIQRDLGVTPVTTHDTMLCQNVVFPFVPKALDYLSSLFCQYHWYWKEDHKEWDMSGTIEDLLLYNCWDNVRTWEIGDSQRILVKHLGMQKQMDFKMETHNLCLRMMNRGVLIDQPRRGHLIYELGEAMANLSNELLTIIPQEWIGPPGKRAKDKSPVYWFQSDKQVKVVLIDFLGFKTILNRKTGEPTSGKEALMQYKLLYPEWSGLLNRLRLAGSVDNTLQVLRVPLELSGRMQCSYNPGGAGTHRLSSSENVFGRGTNLQNVTKGQEDDE